MSYRTDPLVRPLADRHYNRQHIGAPNFVPPGRCFVLHTRDEKAFWVTSWPFAEYVKHAWAGAWVNSAFRREGGSRASGLIRDAIAATRWHYGAPPELGMVTFVDPEHIAPTPMRVHPCDVNCGERNVYGYCYARAGFRHVGWTKGGLWAWQMKPETMPSAEAPRFGNALPLFREQIA